MQCAVAHKCKNNTPAQDPTLTLGPAVAAQRPMAVSTNPNRAARTTSGSGFARLFSSLSACGFLARRWSLVSLSAVAASLPCPASVSGSPVILGGLGLRRRGLTRLDPALDAARARMSPILRTPAGPASRGLGDRQGWASAARTASPCGLARGMSNPCRLAESLVMPGVGDDCCCAAGSSVSRRHCGRSTARRRSWEGEVGGLEAAHAAGPVPGEAA